MRSTVTISLKAAELLHAWLKDMTTKLHMLPEGPEYSAFIELHGAIEDSHYEDKHGRMIGDTQSGRIEGSAQVKVKYTCKTNADGTHADDCGYCE